MNMMSKVVKKEQALANVAEFLNLPVQMANAEGLKEQIKRLCVIKLMKSVGVNSKYNCKSEFFEFFGTVMGQAVCDYLNINLCIAPDNLRLIKYENINFVSSFKGFLNNDILDEAFLDAFMLADKYKHLISEILG